VFFHHSLYSSARHVDDVNDLRTSLVPVMDEYAIDFVLSGHDHFYARSYPLTNFEVAEDNSNVDEDGRVVDPDGAVYFTADSASGSKYYDFDEIDGWTNYYLAAYSQPNEPSYLNVEVKEVENGDTFTVSAYLTADGSEIDTYTIIKIEGDLNSDGVVDRDDFSIIRGLLRQSASVNPAADLDDDGTITIRDARKLITLYTN
jgi:3',5'-cyclic AMP phosphodiesterase CpdA